MTAIEIFNFYTKLGYKVIPLHHSSKIPIFNSWNKKHNINKIKYFLECNPSLYNFGILLGDVIDVEGDSQEANNFLNKIFKNFDHPIFSSSKSNHHLFRNKNKNITRISFNDIEYRAYNHQSVIPPSTHEDGTKYEWITKIMPAKDIPFLPPHLESQIRRCLSKNIEIIKPGHIKVYCYNCKKQIYIHEKRFVKEIQILRAMNTKWECNKCRKFDLRDLIRTNTS